MLFITSQVLLEHCLNNYNLEYLIPEAPIHFLRSHIKNKYFIERNLYFRLHALILILRLSWGREERIEMQGGVRVEMERTESDDCTELNSYT